MASDMFTPGRAGGREVLVWEGSAAAPASPLAWHSRVPVEVFFHTGHHDSTQALASEFTRQLDRQLSALSLLSAERLLEGIRAYRTQGRHPTSTSTRKDKKLFMKEVVRELVDDYQFSREDARAATREVDRALVVLHESDQVTYGPSQPATTAEGWPSLGHGAVNSSIGGQNKPMAAVLEQAALAVPADRRPRVRLLVRAVLTGSPTLAQDLRHGRTHLEPRTQAQRDATSPRGPPWTPTHLASTIATGHTPWHPPPPRAPQPGPDQPGAEPHQPGQPATTRPGPTRVGAATAGPPQTGQPPQADRPGQPPRPLTREEVLARITAATQQAAQDRPGTPTGTARTTRLREASFPHPPTTAARTPPPQAQPQTGPTTDRPSRAGQPGHKITPEEVLADIKARAARMTQEPPTPRQTPTRKHRRNRGLGR
ncbi:polymorphic toxin type 15 domain-containing protein [Actinomyces sp. 2119]|uniref:polymorphic toxin type 15 domain-containing protein n=1 Tax=Actinomyces sp. 2119 TaxID=2321393 RepID=UPI00160477EF|nr:polymorphic toxin type 15 domain-containing protein [Actinomyces sp. 2119]